MNLTPEQIKKLQDEEKETGKTKAPIEQIKLEDLIADLENFDGLFSTNKSIAKALLAKYSITLK